ncbi:MAG: hypothetical protein R3E64_04445 [Halioglobus sp.]
MSKNVLKVRRLASAALLSLFPLLAQAQAPFEFGGLNADLVFRDAVEKSEKLGGVCRVSASKSVAGGVRAHCELAPCTVGTEVGRCQNQPASNAVLLVGTQPVVRIGLEAQDESSPLQRVVFLFDGELDTVAASLTEQFGPPDNDSATNSETSWNHSQRLSWRRGNYTMGLLSSPNLVILTASPPQLNTGAR